MKICPCYNKTICSELSGHNLGYFFKTGRKDKYELLCFVNAYDIMNPSGTDNRSSGGGKPLPIKLYTGALE